MTNMPEEIKELYLSDSVRKNIRIHFPNGERADIINDNIDGENFSFTERICSRSQLKFGLCEASVVKITCVGIENIRGYTIEVYHEIDISSLSDEFITEHGTTSADVPYPYYRWPYGTFVIDECKRQSDMRRRKVVAYSQSVNDFQSVSPVERIKMELLRSDSAVFQTNLIPFVLSNVKGLYRTQEDIISSESAISMDTTKTYQIGKWQPSSTAEAYYYLTATVATLRITGAEMANYYDKMVNFEYDRVADFNNIATDIVEKTFLGDVSALNPVCTINPMLDSFYGYVCPSDKAVFNADTMYYPYMSGLGDEEYIEIAFPLTVRYLNGSEVLYEWEVATGCSAALCELNSEYYTQDLTFERVATEDAFGRVIGYRVDSGSVDFMSITKACLELNGVFGKESRKGGMMFYALDGNFGLFPGDDVFPGDDTIPGEGSGGILEKSNYISLWYDEEYTKPYEAVSVAYVNENKEEAFMEHQIVDKSADGYNADDYQTYSLSDNYLIRNGTFEASQIAAMLERVAGKISGLQYMPARIKLTGIPWVEAGNSIVVVTDDVDIETIVLQRTLKGVQSLKDSFISS